MQALIILIVIIILRALQGGSAPSITKSCTTPDFALSAKTTSRHHEIDYSVTGPPGMRYLLMVGGSGFASTSRISGCR